MISGVRASSIRIESTSSTIAEVVAALHQVVLRPGHVVAQEVEAELVVRAVGDVGRVGGLADLGGLLGQDDADLEAEEPVHPAHPLAVPLGQVVVGGDHVHALALERVEVGRQGRNQGLALAGLHLGDVAEVQRGAAHQLDVEVPLAERALGRLPHHGERLDEQVVGGFPFSMRSLKAAVWPRSSSSDIAT